MSLVGWIVLIALAILVAAFNLGLLAALKNQGKRNTPREGVLGKTIQSLRDPYPWWDEDARLAELSQRMEALRHDHENPPDQD